MDAIAEEGRGHQFGLLEMGVPAPANIDEAEAVFFREGGEKSEAVSFLGVVGFASGAGGIFFAGKPGDMVGLEEDFGGRVGVDPGDDLFVDFRGAVVVKDDEVGVEGEDIGFHGADEIGGGVAADGAVFDAEVGVGVARAEVGGDIPPPGLFRDGLAVEEDAGGLGMGGGGGRQAGHGAFDAGA